jgi:hypothetical protein
VAAWRYHKSARHQSIRSLRVGHCLLRSAHHTHTGGPELGVPRCTKDSPNTCKQSASQSLTVWACRLPLPRTVLCDPCFALRARCNTSMTNLIPSIHLYRYRHNLYYHRPQLIDHKPT